MNVAMPTALLAKSSQRLKTQFRRAGSAVNMFEKGKSEPAETERMRWSEFDGDNLDCELNGDHSQRLI